MDFKAFCNLLCPHLRLPKQLLLFITPYIVISRHAPSKTISNAMKLTAILLLAASLQLSAKGMAQSITLAEKNAPLEKLFNQIEKQTGYSFTFSQSLLKKANKVSIHVRNETLENVLSLCLREQPFAYTIIDKTIVITPKSQSGLPAQANTEVFAVPPPVAIHGKVVNEKGEPVVASILVKGTNKGVTTDGNGEFELSGVDDNATLVISGVGIETFEVKVNGRSELLLHAKVKVVQGEEVTVFSTGYQTISKERATGSFVQVNNELINRRVSTNILDRLDGVTSSILFNRNIVGNTPDISIRGRSTLFANASPLVILDNFPYTGDINNINPNDVEDVTVLRDATAASIWGAQSGNGVIVITTKKGKINQPARISINSNVTVADVPDLFYRPQLSSREFIDVERFLFNKGAYTSAIGNGYSALSPVVAALSDNKNGLLSNADLETRLNSLAGIDSRNDWSQYVYRKSVNQQYSLNLSGGGAYQSYYFSAGYDKNLGSRVDNSYERFTLNGRNSYYAFNKKLVVSSGMFFSFSKTRANNRISNPLYPYNQFADPDGNALPVVRDYRKSYIDTAGAGKLLDWRYMPLNELDPNNTKNLIDYRIDVDVSYAIIPSLKASVKYQYGRGNTESVTVDDVNSYYTRNLINSFTSINRQTGAVTRPVPVGDIVERGQSSYKNHFLRGQLDYSQVFNGVHSIVAIAGGEVKDYNSFNYGLLNYGYDKATSTSIVVDNLSFFPQYYLSSTTKRIPSSTLQNELTDRFRSYYGNIAYTFDRRITVTASARRDESNLFGVRTNQKGVPLWSAGASWEISREKFYKSGFLPYLKLRLTNGYNGNVDRSTSAYTTARLEVAANSFGAPYATIDNPPNPSLRWEKIHILNGGVDFAFKNRRVSGSVDYYVKTGKDLIGNGPIAPQTGLSQFRGNVADLRTNGADVIINSRNIAGAFAWNTDFLFSYSKDIITSYKVKQASNQAYIQTNFVNPLEGKSYSAIFSYPWAGLDAAGDPQSLLGGKISKDYSAISKSIAPEDMVYSGSAIPTIFGSLRNSLSWKGFDLSFNIIYKLGYYFRRSSLDYSSLFAGNFRQADYNKRWMKPGDEAFTTVPSMIYPANSTRDAVYTYSEVLVEKGDHVRLQDIQVGYTLNKTNKKLPFENLRIYGYANNIGIIWRANGYKIDPDAVDTNMPASRSISIGLRATF